MELHSSTGRAKLRRDGNTRRRNERLASERTPDRPLLEFHPMKVLLVADETWIQNEAKAALSDPDTVIRQVEAPRTVAREAEEFKPNVVIVDMQVASMGGMAVARALREAEFAEEIPATSIVLLLDRKADEFLARRAAANAWVVKPFTPQQLRAAIDSAMTSLAGGRSA